MATCGLCSGTGFNLVTQTCGSCQGVGMKRRYDHQGNPIDEEYKTCSGSGAVDVEKSCTPCHGTGEV